MTAIERSLEMAYYLLQVAYTAEAWAAMVKNPHMPLETLRPLLERLGGTLEGGWLALGEYDAVLISQMPDQASAAALAMAASTEGAVKTIKTTPLMTVEESLDALQKAAQALTQTSRRSPTSAGLPVLHSKPVDYKEILSSQLQRFKQRMGKMVTGR
jgi:uncharacterized protein with GYD domain